MSSVEDYANNIMKAHKVVVEFTKAFEKAFGSSADWQVERVVESYLAMFNRFCPLKVGDRVKLMKTYDPGKEGAPGWEHCKHFMIKNAEAVVDDRGFFISSKTGEALFWFDLIFDDESWIDMNGNERYYKPSERHTFRFSEKWVKKL